MVVVTRWYGGIKLGAGGLVRAYGGTAAECLRTAPRQPLIALAAAAHPAAFDDLGAAARGTGRRTCAEKLDETFDADGVDLHVAPARRPVPTPLKTRLRDATRDRVRLATCSETRPSDD